MGRVARMLLLAVATASATGALTGAASAAPLAVDAFVGGPAGSGPGQFRQARSVAVDWATGQTYVLDSVAARVSRMDADGNFELMWGRGVETGGSSAEVCTAADATCQSGSSGTGAGMFAGAFGIAVNQATHDVYVFDVGNRRVQQFGVDDNSTPGDPSDDLPVFERTWGWGVQDGSEAFQICTAGCQAGVEGTGVGQFRTALGNGNLIAVSPVDGDVFVADSQNRRIQRFDADGSLDASPVIGSATQFGSGRPTSIAVDSQGIVYAADRNNGSEIDRYDSAGVHGPPGFLTSIPAPPLLVATPELFEHEETSGTVVDPDTDGGGPDVDRLYVLRNPDVGDTVIQQFDSPGAVAPPASVAETHATGIFGESPVSTLAVDGAGAIYVGSNTGIGHVGGAGYYRFDADGATPAVFAALGTTDTEARSATFNGTVDPTGGAAQYWFEYSRDGVDWTALPTRTVGGSGPQPVTGSVAELEANATYQVRLIARKVLGADEVVVVDPIPQQPFMTDRLPPEIETGGVQQVSATRAQLLGSLNANNLPTDYHFDWGLDDGYGQQIPVPDGLATGGQPQAVGAQLTGLTPETTYHYRLVATNDEGTVEGADRTFTTRPTATVTVPGRALEMVTPPDKVNRRGGENGSAQGFQMALPGMPTADGEAMLFAIGAALLDPDAGTGFPTTPDYSRLAREAGVGWTTETVHDIPAIGSGATPTQSIHGVSADFREFAFWHSVTMFADTLSNLSTKVMGDTGGVSGSGWYDWIGDAGIAASDTGQADDFALIDDGRMVRWGTHRGLLGPGDASLTQVDGRAIYRQEPIGSGPRHLVNVCSTGTTVIERLGDDTISDQPCAAGTVTSRHGAAVGAGGHSSETGPATRAMTEDGKRVFFMSPDPIASGGQVSGCLAGSFGTETDCPPQLFVRQYDSAGAPTVRWLSRPQALGQPIGLVGFGSIYEGASADGQYVFFRTNAPLTPDDPNAGNATAASISSWDLYRYRLAGGIDSDPTGPGAELRRISGGEGGVADANTNGRAPDGGGPALRFLSEDGSRAYFVTTRALPNAAADNTPPSSSSGENVADAGVSPTDDTVRHLYLYDDARTGADRWKFIARLPSTSTNAIDKCATRGLLASQPQVGSSGPFGAPYALRTESSCMRGDSEGRAIVFETTAQLTGDDVDGAGDIYRYDAEADELVRVSAPLPGSEPYSCNEEPSTPFEVCNADLGALPGTSQNHDAYGLAGRYHHNVTEDGRVFFESRLPLVAEDTDGGAMDVYEWVQGELTLASPAGDGPDAFYSGNSTDGVSVFFSTTQRIDPREIEDADADIYVARAGGGFPPPPPLPVLCEVLADGCQGPGGAPISGPIVSDDPGGGGNRPATQRAKLRVARPSRAALRRAARTGRLSLAVRTNKGGRLVVKAKARIGGGRVRQVAATRRRVARAGRRAVGLRLRRGARRQLRRGRPLRVALTVDFSGARTRTLTVVLRRAGR